MVCFYYSIGDYISIPLVDSFDSEYTARLKHIASVISVIVEKWDSTQKDSSGVPEKARLLAYSVRKLACMLSCSDIARLADQDFIRSALSSFDDMNACGKAETAENAMTALCDGFSRIQNRLDMELSPFGYDSTPFIELLQKQRPTGSATMQESRRSRIKHLLMAN